PSIRGRVSPSPPPPHRCSTSTAPLPRSHQHWESRGPRRRFEAVSSWGWSLRVVRPHRRHHRIGLEVEVTRSPALVTLEPVHREPDFAGRARDERLAGPASNGRAAGFAADKIAEPVEHYGRFRFVAAFEAPMPL